MRGVWFVVLVAGWLAACEEPPAQKETADWQLKVPLEEMLEEPRSVEHQDAFVALGKKATPCRSADDCCIVYDGCHAKVIVVGAAKFEAARALAAKAEAEGWCHKCGTPVLEAVCFKGRCVGRELGFGEKVNETIVRDHCGATLPVFGKAGRSPAVPERASSRRPGRLLPDMPLNDAPPLDAGVTSPPLGRAPPPPR